MIPQPAEARVSAVDDVVLIDCPGCPARFPVLGTLTIEGLIDRIVEHGTEVHPDVGFWEAPRWG